MTRTTPIKIAILAMGGEGGGVLAGTPEDVVRAGTPTGVALAPVLVR